MSQLILPQIFTIVDSHYQLKNFVKKLLEVRIEEIRKLQNYEDIKLYGLNFCFKNNSKLKYAKWIICCNGPLEEFVFYLDKSSDVNKIIFRYSNFHESIRINISNKLSFYYLAKTFNQLNIYNTYK